MHKRLSTLPWVAVSLLCCGGPSPAVSPAASTPAPEAAPTPATPSESATPVALEPPAATPTEPLGGAVGTVSLHAFERVLDKPIRSIAVGKPPRVAALADQPYLLDTDGWQPKPLPSPHALGAQSRVEIFFGRDNRPRLMGTTTVADDGTGTEAIYLRLKAAGWQKEPSEIGRLGGKPAGGLFGVLGHDDPEVVCKVNDVCIVKRRTGWTTLPAGAGMPRVFMHDGAVHALHNDRVSALGDAGWSDLPGRGPFTQATGLWGRPGVLWVSVASQDALYVREGDDWKRMASPVKEPRGMWGTSANDVWVTGQDGAGHYDGATWRRVAGPEGPLEVATGSVEGTIWLGGRSGLWRGEKR